MQTELKVDNKKYIEFLYPKCITIILLIGLFTFWAFPSKSSTGEPEIIIDKPSLTTCNYSHTDFMDEEKLRKVYLAENREIENKAPKVYPTLSSSVLESKFIRQGSEEVNKVAITFDDGPYLLTEKYIEVLQTYDVPATFFMIGVQIEKYPDSAKKIIENGYEVGIHSYAHTQLTRMSIDPIDDDFQKTITAIKNIADTDIRFFRPPFGDFNDSIIQIAKSYDLTTVLWCIDPRDWQKDDPDAIAEHIIEKAENGAIILLHEGREGTLAALPLIIEGLRENNFEIVSLSELLSVEQ